MRFAEKPILPLPVQEGVRFAYIPGCPGYAVSNLGDVFSSRAHLRNHCWRKMKPRVNESGYLQVEIRREESPRRIGPLVHCLVLKAFVGPRPEGHECCHNDGNQRNNRLENLRWGTHQENSDDRVRHGNSCRGEKNPNAKLTAADVADIRRRRESGSTFTQLGRHFGVSRTTVRDICLRKWWLHVS